MSWGPLLLKKYKDEQFQVVWYLWYTVHIDMHDQLLISSMSIPWLDFISWIFRPFKLRNAHCSNFVCISPSATRNVLWCLSALAFGSTCSQILVFCWLPCDGRQSLLVGVNKNDRSRYIIRNIYVLANYFNRLELIRIHELCLKHETKIYTIRPC